MKRFGVSLNNPFVQWGLVFLGLVGFWILANSLV